MNLWPDYTWNKNKYPPQKNPPFLVYQTFRGFCKALDLPTNSMQILINYKWQNWHIKSENGRCQLEDHRLSLFIDTFGCKEFEQKPSPWCHIKFQCWCDWRKHVFCWICILDCHLLLLFLRWNKLWTRHYQN